MPTRRPAVRRASVLFSAAALALVAASDARTTLVYGLTDENDLVHFDSGSPGDLISGGAISGLGGQDLIGIDIRPSNSLLYGVGNLGGVFSIDPNTRVATLVSTLDQALSGTRYGVDFNPVVDRLRVVSDTDQNLRVNVDTGATVIDTNLNYPSNAANDAAGATGDNPNVTGAAYTNSFAGAGSTTLYDIDVRSTEDRLVIQDPPNSGILTHVGPLGVNASALLGFDIYISDNTNVGLAAMQLVANGTSNLYSINLTTGAASLIGEVGGGDLLDGLTVVPEPGTLSLLALAAGAMILPRRRRA